MDHLAPHRATACICSRTASWGLIVLTGRDFELDMIAAALRRAQSGHGALVLLSGPLGIGKSVLLGAVGELGRAAGTLTLRASAAPMERDFGYGVARQLLEPTLRRSDEETITRWTSGSVQGSGPVLADRSLDVSGPQQPTSADAVPHALAALLETMSHDRPLLVLIDDLQWSDDATLVWLRHLVRRLQSLPVLLVCTLREGDPQGDRRSVGEVATRATHVLHPSRFDREDTSALIRRQYNEPADDEFVTACQEASAGNPLFLTSILTEASFGGLRPTAPNVDALTALRPSLLRQRLVLCLETQSEPVRRLAAAMAILGDAPHLDVLSRLAALDTVGCREALRGLAELGLLTDTERPRLIHPVVRDAVEEGMPLAERTTLHALAAELLHRAGRPAEEVADQLMATTAPLSPWATRVLRSAAGNSLYRGAPDAAALYLRRALLDSSPQGSDRGRLLVDLATAERSFAPMASVRHISQAVPLLDSAFERAEAIARLPPTALFPAPLPFHEVLRKVAMDLGREDGLHEADRETALRLEARLWHASTADPAQLGRTLARLANLGSEPRTSTTGERELLTVLLNTATVTNSLPAAVVARLSNRILEREPALPTHVHSALLLTVLNLTSADSLDDVTSWLEMARLNASQQLPPVERHLISAEFALVSLACGRLAVARDRATEAFELDDVDHDEAITISAISLAAVALQSRDAELTERLLNCRHRMAGEPYLLALLSALKASVAARAGDLRAAVNHFIEAGQRLEQIRWHNPVLLPWASNAALLHHRLGDEDRATELSELELERARTWGAAAGLGRALTVCGRVTDGASGVDLLRRGVDVLESSANRFELGKSLVALGERVGPSSPEGTAALRRAYALAVECDAPWLAQQAGAQLGGVGQRHSPSHIQLTPAERKVAHLAVSGLTNQAIADELGITCRAVEKSLTSCYRKMSIKGRSALAPALHAQEELVG